MRIVHISDPHFGWEHLRIKFEEAVRQINELEPDLVVLTGDVALWGIQYEFKDAYEGLSKIKSEMFIIPGNHDAKNDGLKYFKLYFGKTKKSMSFDICNVVGVDSTQPDLDEGYVGSEQCEWMVRKFRRDKINILALHHHIIPIPHTGRNMNVLIDAAEILEQLILRCSGGIVLCGHRHVPYSTKVLRTHIIHAGTASSYKVLMPDHNYNIIEFDEESFTLKLRFLELGEIEVGTFKIKLGTPEPINIYNRLTRTKKVLFISKHNSCRTRIAEAIFNKMSPENMLAISAGVEPTDVDQKAVEVLKEYGMDIGDGRVLNEEWLKEFDYVVSFDDELGGDEHWTIPKPNTIDECRNVLNTLEKEIKELIKKVLIEV